MKKEELYFRSSAGTCNIRTVLYLPEEEPKAILQIAHGMDEFIDRYEDFASFLCGKGFLVAGNDFLGHGASINTEEDWGYFAEKDGNGCLLKDMASVTKLVKQCYPNKPYFLLGHSMGSFYARQYICDYPDNVEGAIIMGTGMQPKAVVKAGMAVCKTLALFKGWHYRSGFVNKMATGSYNRQFEPARTRADWLTKDKKIVDWYIKEPRCSFLFTLNGYYSMFQGILRLHDKKLLAQMNKELPMFFVSGAYDPVGANGEEVELAMLSVREAGVQDVQMKLYPEDRHEILNETDRKEVYQDLYDWMYSKIIR